MKHHKYHYHPQVKAAKLHARAEAALDFLTAIAIGIGLAAALFYGWSA
jgi:divalent metal cation (Fe/Co/Zn/Cd) transporter